LEHAVDYFPYGSILREYVNGRQERYLTTQHERDQETGLDYRGARYYDADVARFLSLDPKAMEFASWSAYNYVLGDPIRLVDPDGKAPGCGCPTPPCGEVVQRLEAMYNVIADPIVQARNDAMKSIGEGFSAIGDWLNGWAGDGGYTLTTTTRDAPPNNADRKGDPSGQINVDYLMDYQSASKLGPKKFSPTLPDPGPQTFVEGYNKLWKAGELLTGSGQSSQGGAPVRSDTSYSTAPTTGSFATPDGFFNGEWYNAGDTMSSDYPAGNPVRKWQARTNPSF
jgi:RHS repeat-associated protein